MIDLYTGFVIPVPLKGETTVDIARIVENPDRSGPDPGPESVSVQEWPDPDSDFSLPLSFSLE